MYVWSRRNPGIQLNFFETITFSAPYLPVFYLALDALFIGTPKETFIGYLIGHLYYFFEDVLPFLPGTEDVRVLKTPLFLERICEWVNFQPVVE